MSVNVKDVMKKIKQKTRLRTRYRNVLRKVKTASYIYRTNGRQGLSLYVKEGVKKRFKKEPIVKSTGDVLFISIDEPLLDRYRTDHMIEALESTGMSVGKIFYYELTLEHIKNYNVFIFYRCPWLPGFEDIFNDIKKKNKVSIYAVDDLVIDRKYTDTLPVVQALSLEDRLIYDDGVERHGKLMRFCDHAIVTTTRLVTEVKKYTNLKNIYLDRNSMSEEMIYYADKAIKEVKRDENKIIIGYFSGTNTHNEDFQMIAPALIRILKKYDNTYIKLAGRVDAPTVLKEYEDRIIFTPYVNWRQLPYELRECNITLSPLVNSLFNEAKSEIKWAESSLVEVATIASDMGSFKDAIKNKETGILVENTENAWYEAIDSLVKDEGLRQKIAKQSRAYVLRNYRTTGDRAVKLRTFIDKVTPNIIAFAGVNISAISGGNIVIKKHMNILRDAGNIVYGVESMDYHEDDEWLKVNQIDDKEYDIFRVNSHRRSDRVNLRISFDRYVATFWDSVENVDSYRYIKTGGKKLYLVQNMEAGFYKGLDTIRRKVIATYRNFRITPITISKWCQKWLKDDFNKDAEYAPNGIDIKKFPYSKRDWTGRKIKILIEGDSSSDYKRVDESFKIANQLDKEKFEVSYLSYNAKPKDWYDVDNVYVKIPPEEVGEIYISHDILIKSSVLESFSYPPLEIMATGGVPVLVKNDGNAEYVKDGKNAFYYEEGNIDDALSKIKKLVSDVEAFHRIAENGRETAQLRSWDDLKDSICKIYE